jgi:hypothetical protein
LNELYGPAYYNTERMTFWIGEDLNKELENLSKEQRVDKLLSEYSKGKIRTVGRGWDGDMMLWRYGDNGPGFPMAWERQETAVGWDTWGNEVPLLEKKLVN